MAPSGLLVGSPWASGGPPVGSVGAPWGGVGGELLKFLAVASHLCTEQAATARNLSRSSSSPTIPNPHPNCHGSLTLP